MLRFRQKLRVGASHGRLRRVLFPQPLIKSGNPDVWKYHHVHELINLSSLDQACRQTFFDVFNVHYLS